MDRCPACNGFGKIFPVPNKKLASIPKQQLEKLIECDVCSGTGEIRDEQKIWIRQGELLRSYRQEKLKLGLREACRKYGIDPSNLSKMERGIIKPKPPKELYNLR